MLQVIRFENKRSSVPLSLHITDIPAYLPTSTRHFALRALREMHVLSSTKGQKSITTSFAGGVVVVVVVGGGGLVFNGGIPSAEHSDQFSERCMRVLQPEFQIVFPSLNAVRMLSNS